MIGKSVFFVSATIFWSITLSDAFTTRTTETCLEHFQGNMAGVFSFQRKPSLRAKNHLEDNRPGAEGVWLPQVRRVMGSIAAVGAIETGYLTLNKLQGRALPFCGVDGGCNDILNGSYSVVPFTQVPLSAIGFVAYLSVLGLSLFPLLSNEERLDDIQNRIFLTSISTAMATFSIFLLTLLFGVLQSECPFCEISAACSISLAMFAWIGGCLPENSKAGAKAAGSSFLTSTVVALLLFVSGDSSADALTTTLAGSNTVGSSTLLASGANAPPSIESQSSQRAIAIANDLQSLDAKMYGAFWCSHCYDQKETLGKEGFSKIPYIECSKDGLNSQNQLCRSKELPGYPTWEINGKLYPGENSLEELEEIVANIRSGK
jgi:uncharacterized membrane protein